jgi:hypothetical protein
VPLGEQLRDAIEDPRPLVRGQRMVQHACRRVERATRLGRAALRDPADDLARERRAHVRPRAGLDLLAVDQQRAVLRRRHSANSNLAG